MQSFFSFSFTVAQRGLLENLGKIREHLDDVFLAIRLFVHSFHRSLGQPVVRLIAVNVTDNPPTLPGVDDSVYVSTANHQYHDDAEEFLDSEVLSYYGDVLVSFN